MTVFKEMQYPAQSGMYAVKVKNGAGWRNYSAVRLQISVGQEYHEGGKFKATINWVAHRFDKITVCVNDTLQKYNHMYAGMTEEEAYKKAESDGREWIERNQHMWRHIRAVEVVRWDTWKNHISFSENLFCMEQRYKNDLLFKAEVDQEIASFWDRRIKTVSASSDDFEQFEYFSKRYLLEEVAIFPIMSENMRAVDVYPGSTLLPCKLNNVQDLGQRGYTRIDFKKNLETNSRHVA